MTFCKTLKEAVRADGKTVTAVEEYEKFSSVPHYKVYLSADGMAIDVVKAAKTTWSKRFTELMERSKS